MPVHHRKVRLRHTSDAGLGFVLNTERHPDNARFVCQWTERQHRAAVEDGNCAHRIVETQPDGRAVGYVIVSGLDGSDHNLELKRITITAKGHGYGRQALRAVQAPAFGRLGADRLWLDVMSDNRRARRLYEEEGFVREDRSHRMAISGGRSIRVTVMAVRKSEYAPAGHQAIAAEDQSATGGTHLVTSRHPEPAPSRPSPGGEDPRPESKHAPRGSQHAGGKPDGMRHNRHIRGASPGVRS